MTDNIAKEPFKRYKLDEEKENEKGEIFTVRLNEHEYKVLQEDKKLLRQSKDSTALKTLAELGHIVLHDALTHQLVDTIFKNKQRNQRTGLGEFDN